MTTTDERTNEPPTELSTTTTAQPCNVLIEPGEMETIVGFPARFTSSVQYQGEDITCIKMTTAFLDDILRDIGEIRHRMLPPIPAEWKLGQVSQARRDPAFSIETDQLAGDVLLHLRDERFGWIHYIISKEQALQLGQLMVSKATAPPPPTAGLA